MPILPAEPDCYPPDLWENPASIVRQGRGASGGALHTKPRQEKAIAPATFEFTESSTTFLKCSKKVARPRGGRFNRLFLSLPVTCS